jgi:penicillin-binding protein 1A
VTLKEMVTAYGSIVNDGRYVEPMLVTRIERRDGTVVADFQPRAPEQGLSPKATRIVLDVMRGAVDRGTGAAIRSRWGIRGDVAGKTGTTQDYTDGWFILMHPQLVGGAWMGFNDNRITMRNGRWGQGSRNALHVVGDFYQQAQQTGLIDTKARFAAPRLKPKPIEPMPVPGNEWLVALEPNGLPPDQPPARPAIVAQPEFQWIPEPPRGTAGPAVEFRRGGEIVILSPTRSPRSQRRPPVVEHMPASGHSAHDGGAGSGGAPISSDPPPGSQLEHSAWLRSRHL